MLAEYKTKTNIGVGLGIVAQVAGRMLMGQGNTGVGAILVLVGAVLFIWGCCNYTQGKGYSGWLGLLGLLSCIGLLILVFLPDKHKSG